MSFNDQLPLLEDLANDNVTISSKNSHKDRALTLLVELEQKFAAVTAKNPELSRSLVSFQANKSEPIFRWFKYREGFSRELIDYCLDELDAKAGDSILDPFSGTGATVFTSADRGLQGTAVELLPVGCYFMRARQHIRKTPADIIIGYAQLAISEKPWESCSEEWKFPHLRITGGAFPQETSEKISKYKTWISCLDSAQSIFMDFVLFSVLEEISFTRKDGQYLRWDYRAGRGTRKTSFDKGRIFSFDEAILSKLDQVIRDLTHRGEQDLLTQDRDEIHRKIKILNGSVFEVISEVPDNSIDYVITSPPYCNRYDYTRTYALELAYLGVNEDQIRKLRQSLLTCTVENRPKSFDLLDQSHVSKAMEVIASQDALQAVLAFIREEKASGQLNNDGILTMLEGYFAETAIHLTQVYEKMKVGGKYVMVNDNVQYNGLPIPVDCLLSNIAEAVGFSCEKIWVLPVGKGNSSQQMKKHGRTELRKCVYIWKKN
jgi:hypothetical protein